MSISILIVAPLSGFLKRKFQTRDLIQVGMLFSLLGLYLLWKALDVTAAASDLGWGLFSMGIGMGITMSLISNITLSAVDTNMAGEASGVNNTIRQLGSSLGSAIIGAIFLTAITTGMVTGVNDSKILPVQAKGAIITELQKNSSQYASGTSTTDSATESPAARIMATEIKNIKNQATVDASKKALAITGIFSLAALIVTAVLPRNIQDKEGAKVVAGH
jgi:hypothetical protein